MKGKKPSMDYIDLGRRIRRLRTGLGLTQMQLAEMISVSTSYIGHVERGTRKASIETLVAIANALHVGLDYMLAGSLTFDALEPKADDLSRNQRIVLNEIISTMQTHLLDWNKPDD